MDLDKELNLEHLLFCERKCRTCGEKKDLVSDFYLIRKGKGTLPSAYSYECKECTKERTISNRKRKTDKSSKWEYPDW